jgi:hypothetical protein
VRQAAGLIALAYAVLVVTMSAADLASGPTLLAYAIIAVVAPVAVVVGDRLGRSGDRTGDWVAQAGLGVIAGMWALPASSGLIAILAVVAGALSAFRSAHGRWSSVLALVSGALVGVGVLAASFSR